MSLIGTLINRRCPMALKASLNLRVLCIALGASVALSACSSHKVSNALSGTPECRQIGCGKGLTFYPNEVMGAKRQAKEWHGWDYGKTSSAYSPSDPKHWELKAKEIQAGQTPYHWNNQ